MGDVVDQLFLEVEERLLQDDDGFEELDSKLESIIALFLGGSDDAGAVPPIDALQLKKSSAAIEALKHSELGGVVIGLVQSGLGGLPFGAVLGALLGCVYSRAAKAAINTEAAEALLRHIKLVHRHLHGFAQGGESNTPDIEQACARLVRLLASAAKFLHGYSGRGALKRMLMSHTDAVKLKGLLLRVQEEMVKMSFVSAAVSLQLHTALAKLAGYSGGTMDKLQAGITALRGQADVQRGEQSNVQRPQALLGEQVAAAAEGDEADLCSLLRHGANVNEVNKGSTMHAFAYIAELSLTIYHELQAANYNVKDCEGLAVTVQELHRILMQCGSGTALNDSWLADGNALTVTIIDVHHTLQDARNLVDEVDRLRDLFLIKQLAGAKSMRDQFRSVKESLHTHMRTLSLYMQVNGQQRHDEAMTPFSALKQQRMGTSYSAPFMHYAPPDGAPALPPPHWLNASSSAPIYQQFQQPHQQHHAHSSAPPAAAATPYPGLQHQQKQKQQQYAMAHHASVQWYGRPMSEDGAFAAAGAPLLSPSGPSASSGSHPRVASASGASYHHGQQQSPHYQQQQQQQQRHYSSQTPPVGTGTESYLSVSGLSAGGFYAPPCVAAAPVQQQGARTAHCRSAAIALLGTSASMDEDLQEWLVLETMRKLQNETPLDHDAAEKDAAIALMATAATSVGMSAGFSAQPSVASAGASAAATPTTAGGPGAGYLMGSVSSTSLAARSVNLIDLDASSTGSVAAAVVAADDDLRRRFAVLAGGSPQVVGWSQPAIDMFSDMFGATRTAPRPPMAAAAAAVPFVNAPPPFPGAAVPPALGGFESAADLFGDIPAFVFPLVPAAVCSAPVPSRRGGLVYNDKGVVYEDQNVQDAARSVNLLGSDASSTGAVCWY